MQLLYGVVVPMTTPFDKKGNVNISALEQQTEFLIDKEVHGLYPCGTTGEMLLMSLDERELVAETVVKKTAGRIPVFIQCGAIATKDTLRLAAHAKSIGADGIGVVTSSFFGINDKAMIEYYKTIAKSLPNDFPIYLYNIPQCSTNDIKPEICEKLVQSCPNIIGIKYSGNDPTRVLEYIKINNYNFSVLVGPDRHFLQYMVVGCTGTVSSTAGIIPEIFVGIYNAYQTGDMDKALELQRKANDVIDILKAGTNLSMYKEAQVIRGLARTYVRPPLLDITEMERKELASGIMRYL